ncbi:MAG: helix-turn-helix transcriptional regulator [Desulfobacterales bacterium]|nr:helix-turn-helix transcriptional regulator [Desulfobacterales bacterium]
MENNEKSTNAVGILHGRYIGDDPDRKASIQVERVNAEVARMIYELRKQAGMTQKGLAKLVGTTQSVISRLEDSDYEGHSLSMLGRIAKALNRRLTIEMPPGDNDADALRHVFREVVQGLRKKRGLGIDLFAEKSGINRADVVAMERAPAYRPAPAVLKKLSDFYNAPHDKMAALAGSAGDVPDEIREEALKYAALSDSFSQLTEEEKRALDGFVKFLKEAD